LPANPVLLINFHDIIKNKLIVWKKDPNKGKVYVTYGLSPFPWAKLCSEVDEVLIPLPKTFKPYSGWQDWMRGYLEQQVRVVGDELNEPVYVMTNKGNLISIKEED